MIYHAGSERRERSRRLGDLNCLSYINAQNAQSQRSRRVPGRGLRNPALSGVCVWGLPGGVPQQPTNHEPPPNHHRPRCCPCRRLFSLLSPMRAERGSSRRIPCTSAHGPFLPVLADAYSHSCHTPTHDTVRYCPSRRRLIVGERPDEVTPVHGLVLRRNGALRLPGKRRVLARDGAVPRVIRVRQFLCLGPHPATRSTHGTFTCSERTRGRAEEGVAE